jgi:integrase
MASVSITRRRTKSGPRYIVRYRLGGRAYPITHGGSFTRERDAKTRRDFIAGELAAGRDPRVALRALLDTPDRRTLRQEFERFMASRVDVGPKTQALYGNARDRLRSLAQLDPHEVTPSHVQAWIAENSAASGDFRALSPKSLGHYLSSLRQVLDFCDVTPNPARSPKVKLPESVREEIAPPSGAEWTRIKARLSKKLALPLRLKECCALRTKEIRSLTYGDVDFAEGRIRVSRARTKRRTAGQRWLPVPPELLDAIDALVPLEDRHHDRRVFPKIEEWTLGAELERACRLAGTAHYPPHQLRHRRCSLWIRHGVDEVTAARWAGHAKASMTLDVYGHVLIDPSEDEWRDFWHVAYVGERSPGVVSVWSEGADNGRDPALQAKAKLQET